MVRPLMTDTVFLAQKAQRRDLARKKEYLRRADESCRTVLHQCRAAGGYLGPLPY